MKLNSLNFPIIAFLLFVMVGCAAILPGLFDPKTIVINATKEKGEVLKEYQKGSN